MCSSDLANQSYSQDPAAVQAMIAARVQVWEQGGDGARRLMNAELSRFLLGTKVRDGDKVVGLLIADKQGALVAASSDPDHFVFANEPWWAAIHVARNGCFGRSSGRRRRPSCLSWVLPVLDRRSGRCGREGYSFTVTVIVIGSRGLSAASRAAATILSRTSMPRNTSPKTV